ncbi:MAG: DUF4105 domain-containing protein [Leptospirillia bacterium]
MAVCRRLCAGLLYAALGLSLTPWPAAAVPFEPAPVAPTLSPRDADYLAELVARAEAQNLSGRRYWQVLMHYRKTVTGGMKSEVDGADFFNVSHGKTDPGAELSATLRAFFAPPASDPLVQHPQCRFIARFRWLDSQLGFDPARLSPQPCPRYSAWRGTLGAETVTVVFPSAYLNNPASMFGHTLLRTDHPDKDPLLDYAINYEAHPGTSGGLGFAFKGLVGLYPGRFSLLPYYAKVKTYGEFENRDLWEYRLGLNADEIERMLAHTWELGPTWFRYYFFKENCSYHLLSLIEAARPELDLTRRFHFWTIPTDTLRALRETPGLVAEVTFRPAGGTRIQHRMARLSRRERTLSVLLSSGRETPDGESFQALPPARKAEVLDIAHAQLQYRIVDKGREAPEAWGQRSHLLLTHMSQLDSAPEKVPVPVPKTAPDEGHATHRATLSGGRHAGKGFYELAVRGAYHDLLDPDPGYAPDAQLDFMELAVRHEPGTDRVKVDRLTVLDLFSLSPRDRFFKKRSWKVSLGWRRLHAPGCESCGALRFSAGPGMAWRLATKPRTVAYLFAVADAAWGDDLKPRHAVGAGGRIGMVTRLSVRTKAHLWGRALDYFSGMRLSGRETGAELRWQAGDNLALRFGAHARSRAGERVEEVSVSVNRYF